MGFQAKYASGTCPFCHRDIQPGEEIEVYAGGRITRYQHSACGRPHPDDILAPPGTMCSICGGEWNDCAHPATAQAERG